MFETFVSFVRKEKGPNRFWPIDKNQIDEAESRMGVTFPPDLRVFFTEVGSGFWAQGIADAEWDRSLVNRLPSPGQIADLVCDDQNPWRPREGFVDGAIPFFDVGEDTYLVLLPQSDVPSRVYWSDGKQVVTESVEEFFNELHQHAGFYLDS
jgi:antitoxin YxxD